MTTNEMRSKIQSLRLYIEKIECNVEFLRHVIYKIEDKICTLELESALKKGK